MQHDDEEDTARLPSQMAREERVHQVEDLLGITGALDQDTLHLQFQDSSLSPALPLLLYNTKLNLNEYSALQHSDLEFAPLRPDTSAASQQVDLPLDVTQSSSGASLSQHPLAQTTILSDKSDSSCSQFSFSLQGVSRVDASVHEAFKQKVSRGSMYEFDSQEDDTYFLSKHVPAQHLLDLLQKDVGVMSSSSSSSAVSSHRSSSGRQIMDQSRKKTREGPSGEAFLSQERSRTSLPEVCNVSMGSRGTKPDASTESLRRELIVETRSEARLKKSGDKVTPKLAATAGQSVSTGGPQGLPWTGSILTGVERVRRQDFFSPDTQTGIDGSYLGFLPQSQSTPGFFNLPLKSAKPTVGKLSDIESTQEVPDESSAAAQQSPEETSSTRVSSLPSLDYKQKVDAWREYQTSGEPSILDSLAMKGFLGTSPKKRADDSDSLNPILSQHIESLRQPESAGRSSSAVHSGSSSPRRADAADGVAGNKDGTTSSAQPSASPFGRSQSHSSLSTVVMSTQTEQQPGPEPETRVADEAQKEAVEPSTSYRLERVSDVSPDRDLTPSPSQDSCDVKPAASVGASSVISLEVDNYAPYWTSKPSTPAPQLRELNIEERIPMYLHNLGIDQSPSAILTPFVPRGPIREPEFSPTDLSTIKGSIGTPSRSAQPSEGGSPLKGEFSRTSILSADSSISIPISLDGLGPGVSTPEQHRVSLSSGTSRTSRRLAACFDTEPQTSTLSSEASIPNTSQHRVSLTQDAGGSDGEVNTTLQGSQGAVLDPSPSTQPFSTPTWTKSASSPFRRQSSIGQESSSVPQSQPSTETYATPQRDGEISSLNISKSTRRAEPEGCSAAPPDPPATAAPPDPPAAASNSSSASEDAETVPREEEARPEESGSSKAVQAGSDRGTASEAGSEGSLTVKVVKLLQMETPSTITTSTPSTTDLEDSRIRDWIRLKKSGELSKLPELLQEDREQIEEIKRELLLKNPLMSRTSSDTESRSSDGAPGDQDVGTDVLDAKTLREPLNLEAQVRQIAAREGVAIRGARATVRTPTPSPAPTPEPLLLSELRSATLGSTGSDVPGPAVTSSLGSEGVDQPDGSFDRRPSVDPADPPVPPVDLPDAAPAAPSNQSSAPEDFVPLRPATSSLISPDEGVGLSSPPEWIEAREPTGSGLRSDPLQQLSFRTLVGPHRSSDTPVPRATAPPVLLPYKPHGSKELFFIPRTEPEISSTSMESSHTGSNDAVPPHFSSDVLGQQDPGLDRGVTLRHAEGIYSKRTMQATALRVSEQSSQTKNPPAPNWTSLRSAGTRAPPQSTFQRAPRSTKDQGTSPIQSFSPYPAGNIVAPSTQDQSPNLDQLWSRFHQQWTSQESRPDRDSEASLLERLERLSRLIKDSRSWTGPRSRHDERVRAEPEDSRLSSSCCQDSSNSLCPADQDESSASMSTVDTARLLRAFGSHRVQQIRSSSSLGRLYGNIGRQKEAREWVLDSTSSSSFLDSPHQRHPRTLKPPRMVSRGIQAGHLEIVSDATRRHTRDVGTTFPSPPESTAPPQVDSEAEPQELRTSGPSKRRSRRSHTGPPGVTWFISAEELRSEERKENQQGAARRPGTSWFEPVRRRGTLREPLRQVQQNQEVEPDPPPMTMTSPGSKPVSLQESLQRRRPAFMVQSRERTTRLAVQAEERKLFDTMSRERDLLLLRNKGRKDLERIPEYPAEVPVTQRAVSRKEMIQRTKLIYQSLPEVRRKKEEERRRAAYDSYRLNALVYNKRIQNRVLEKRRSAWK